MDKIKIMISLYRLIPTFLIINCSKAKKMIFEDAKHWSNFWGEKHSNFFVELGCLLFSFTEFRNVVFNRLRYCDTPLKGLCFAYLFSFFYPIMDTLYINTSKIGHRLLIQHGFATIICAKEIGDECWINQQVTIGYSNGKGPVLGNHIRVCAGAKIIGGVKIGDNSIIGAGAVVVKDIPPNEVWGGVPAHFIKYNAFTEFKK